VGTLSSELTVSAGCCTNTGLLPDSRLAMSVFGKYVEFCFPAYSKRSWHAPTSSSTL
jgi:hypothetical protein